MQIINEGAISAYYAKVNTKKAIDDFMETEAYALILSAVYKHIRMSASRGEGLAIVDFTTYKKKWKVSPSLLASALGKSLIQNGYRVDFKIQKKHYLLLIFWGLPEEKEV